MQILFSGRTAQDSALPPPQGTGDYYVSENSWKDTIREGKQTTREEKHSMFWWRGRQNHNLTRPMNY